MKNKKPPKISSRILERLLDEDVRYSAMGDFEERYEDLVKRRGALPAGLFFRIQILLLLPTYIKTNIIWGSEMFKNYLKVTLRIFKRQKGYSFINIFGLAVGMACCLMIMLWVKDELSYDRYHEHGDNIYRLTYAEMIGGAYDHYALAPFPAAPAFKQEIPEFKAFTRLLSTQALLKTDTKSLEQESIFFAEKDFFRIFTAEFTAGKPDSCLENPASIVLTQDLAEKLFSNQDPIGRTLSYNGALDLLVTAVVKDTPQNSHFRYDCLISLNTLKDRLKSYLENWFVIIGYNYFLLEDGADISLVAQKMNDVAQRHAGTEARKAGLRMEYIPQRVKDIYLYSNAQDEIGGRGNILYVYVFSIVAVFILCIACINFMNLSTARSALRGREVGLRKVFGARKKRLINQFLTESLTLSFWSMALALLLVWILLPAFNGISGKAMNFSALNSGPVWAGIAAIFLLTGVGAGSYPAFFLSSFQPIAVLRGRLDRGPRRSVLRSGLVTFQFTISVMLLIGTFVILQQINHMKNRNLGFEKEQVMVVRIKGRTMQKSFESFRESLRRNPNIIETAYSDGIPGRVTEVMTVFQEGRDESVSHTFNTINADYDFLKTYGIELHAGRNFSKEFVSDTQGVLLINRTAAAKLGWPEEAIGKRIGFDISDLKPVVGVTSDFHYRSLKELIEPLVIVLSQDYGSYLSLKVSTDNLPGTIAFIHETWQDFEKERSFSYFFVDDNFNSLYQSEDLISRIISIFTFLAMFIACLGLFGLASFTVEQSVKEIGIRKVLGASVKSIILHLNRNFSRWVLVANFIAWPLVYLLMERFWLSKFPFRIHFSIWIFLLAGLITLFTALITVSAQSIKAALANPADSLRNE